MEKEIKTFEELKEIIETNVRNLRDKRMTSLLWEEMQKYDAGTKERDEMFEYYMKLTKLEIELTHFLYITESLYKYKVD